MPRKPAYAIGDIVNHKILGQSIVLGHQYSKFTWYHIYSEKFNRFGYYLGASFELTKPATATTIQEAQNLLLQIRNTNPTGPYKSGDVLYERNTRLLVIDNGRQCDQNNMTTYLVYNEKEDRLYYMDFAGCAQVIQQSNLHTRKFVGKIMCDRIFDQAFSTTT